LETGGWKSNSNFKREHKVDKDLKILVVDDTVVYRRLLSKIVSDFKDIKVVGVASNGKLALSKIKLRRPDLVLLDVFMPEMDGLETLDHIKKQYSDIDVIILSGVNRENANLTMKALGAGALDFILKPSKSSMEENIAELRSALSRLILMARTRKYSRQARSITVGNSGLKLLSVSEKQPHGNDTKKRAAAQIYQSWPGKDQSGPGKNQSEPDKKPDTGGRHIYRQIGRIDVIAIGVSTGGPNALQKMIPGIEADFPVPILTVQHMPAMFTASLATRLDKSSAIKVLEARDGQRIEKGVMYIAPGGSHMVVRKDKSANRVIGLLSSPPVNSCRPSADVLFRSIAAMYRGHVLTVVLTGMGNDGVSGVTEIRSQGGYSLVQDEKSSVIWGMPGAVADADQADEIVCIDRMASRIMGLVKKGQIHVQN